MTNNVNNYSFVDQTTQRTCYKLDGLKTVNECQRAANECRLYEYLEKAKAVGLDTMAIFSGISLTVVAYAVGKVAFLMVGVATLPLQFFLPFYPILLIGSGLGSAGTFLYVTLRPLWNKLKIDAKAHWDYAQHLQTQRIMIQQYAQTLKA